MKAALAVISLVAVIGGGACFWAFHGSSDAPLTADDIVVFQSEKALAQHYGFIGKTYTAVIPTLPNELKNRPEGYGHYFRVAFSAERPASLVRSEAMAELNRVRAQSGKKAWSTAALNKSQLYTMAADLEMTGEKRGHMTPDVTLFQRQEDSVMTGLKLVFQANQGAGLLSTDPGDPHILMLSLRRDENVLLGQQVSAASTTLTMRFSADWSQADITSPDTEDGPGVKTVAVFKDELPQGAYILRANITGFHPSQSSPEYLFAGLRDSGLINPTIPVYFHPDGEFAGKAYLGDKTYKIRAAHHDGALKLFLDNTAMLSIDPLKPTSSFIGGARGPIVIYTLTMAKTDVQGKEQQLASNFVSLGTVPETVVGAPNVWRTYFPDMGQRHWSTQDIVADPTLNQLFGHRWVSSSAMEANALDVQRQASAAKTAATPTRTRQAGPATKVTQPAAKTDADIEKEMAEKLRKRRY